MEYWESKKRRTVNPIDDVKVASFFKCLKMLVKILVEKLMPLVQSS